MSEWTWQDYLSWGQEINQERMEADWKGLVGLRTAQCRSL